MITFAPINNKRIDITMSTATLSGLRDYLYGTLSPDDMVWLVEELKRFVRKDGDTLSSYSMEELEARIAKSEGDAAEGNVYDFDDVMDEIEAEFSRE